MSLAAYVRIKLGGWVSVGVPAIKSPPNHPTPPIRTRAGPRRWARRAGEVQGGAGGV